jgi:hypothetical protein
MTAEERIQADLEVHRARLKEQAAKAAYFSSLSGFEPPVPDLGERQVWPFKDMEVGDEESYDGVWAKRARAAAHTYASKTGWKFKTYSADDTLYIKRIK